MIVLVLGIFGLLVAVALMYGEQREKESKDKEGYYKATASPTHPPENVYGEIEKLHELKEKGIVTEEEFKAKKKQLLDLED